MPSWDNEPKGTMKDAVLSSSGASPPSKCFTIDEKYPKPMLPSQKWCLGKVKVKASTEQNCVSVAATNLLRRSLACLWMNTMKIPQRFWVSHSQFARSQTSDTALGEEFVGVVETAGSETHFKVGDYVCGLSTAVERLTMALTQSTRSAITSDCSKSARPPPLGWCLMHFQ